MVLNILGGCDFSEKAQNSEILSTVQDKMWFLVYKILI